MRAFVRKFASWVLVGVVLTIATAMASEWFIEVAKDKGLYNDAGARWDAAMSALSSIVLSHTFLYLATALAGFVTGLWLDKIIKHFDTPLRSEPELHLADIDPSNNGILVMPRETLVSDEEEKWKAAGIKNIEEVDANDFDIIFDTISLHCLKTDDGTDVWGSIHYRNRGRKTVFVKHVSSACKINDRPPTSIGTSGIQSSINKETTQVVQFKTVRLYEPNAIQGGMYLYIAFGESRNNVRCGIRMSAKFIASELPKKKGVTIDIDFTFDKKCSYLVGEPV